MTLSPSDHESLFLHRLKRLETFVASGTPFDLADASAVLRQMLLDEYALLVRLSSERGMKLRFRIREYEVNSRARSGVFGDVLDPDIEDHPSSHGVIRELPVDDFLKVPVAFAEGDIASVRDLIVILANVAGGVHVGSVHTRNQQAADVVEAIGNVRMMGMHSMFIPFRAICRVVITASAPLANAIRQERGPNGAK